MAQAPTDLLQGTLDLLILRTLRWGPRHGYGIAKWLEETTAETLVIEEGSLYPALYRMERKGWIEAEWGMSELGRKAKFYGLTPAGRRRFREHLAAWQQFTGAVIKVLGVEPSRA